MDRSQQERQEMIKARILAASGGGNSATGGGTGSTGSNSGGIGGGNL